MMHENDGPPWSPNSGGLLKKYLPGTAEDLHMMGIEGLLDISASPFKNVNGEYNGAGSPLRSTKRPRTAPHSPGTALILEAARAADGAHPSPFAPRQLVPYMTDSPEPALLEAPLDLVSPPSPARTPSRLLFSPRTESRIMMRSPGMASSPSVISGTPYDAASTLKQNDDIVGSIWRHAEDEKRLNNSASARRPLLQQVMTFPEEDEESVLFQSNETAEQTTPGPTTPTNVRRTKGTPRSGSSGGGSSAKRPQSDKRKHDSMTASERKKDKKDRKTYSTAGRPRSRGEYKCGKCGFYPKKEKHDCQKELAKQAKEKANGGSSSTSVVTPSPLRKTSSNHTPREPQT
eukprot:m.108729 g.108729  ORF g.108729 m.108729 type:complete len:346 (+) comp10669_c1_seq1:36-1073(+)